MLPDGAGRNWHRRDQATEAWEAMAGRSSERRPDLHEQEGRQDVEEARKAQARKQTQQEAAAGEVVEALAMRLSKKWRRQQREKAEGADPGGRGSRWRWRGVGARSQGVLAQHDQPFKQ